MFVSTGNLSGKVSFLQTLTHPIPEKGHLWMPKMPLPKVDWPRSEFLRPYINMAVNALTGEDFDFEEMDHFPIDITSENSLSFLNVHHGETKSFKDVGCACAAHIYRQLGMTEKRTVVATSGDTGSAAANAFQKVNLPICVLFPKGKVYPYQAEQMMHCKKAAVMCVDGDFDLCQAQVKHVISQGKAQSCNSISLARLLPQIGYYAYLAVQIPDVTIIVPSGNFGNACAAVMAQKMGAPIGHIHFACNANDAVSRLLHGDDDVYTPKPTVKTLASAMDVGSPSNFVRIWYMCNHDIRVFRETFTASTSSDEEIKSVLNSDKWEKCCPHTATAIHASSFIQSKPRHCVVQTADACKFDLKFTMPYAPLCLNSEKTLVPQNNIVLIGMPSSGKSTIARRFSNGLDTDALICEAVGKPIHQIIAERTTDEFIALESSIICHTVLDCEHSIIATGGSAVYTKSFQDALHSSLVIWLIADREDLRLRLGNTWNSRGVISPSGITDLDPLCIERYELYKKCADIQINTSKWDIDRICDFLHCLHTI